MTKQILVEDGMIEKSDKTGIISISYPTLINWLYTIAFIAAAIGMAIVAFKLMNYFADMRLLLILFVSLYFGYLAYRKFLGTQKKPIEINPETGIVQIKGSRNISFSDIRSLSAEPGTGIALAGFTLANIVLTLKSDEKILIASLSEDEVKVANKVEQIGEMIGTTIGLKLEEQK